MKYIILGVEKCGTTSLERDLRDKGHNVIRWEWAYCLPDIRTFVEKKYPGYKPLIITRDPIQRCYSDYNYAVKQKQIPNISYLQALKKYPRFAHGSCYSKWIKKGDTVFDVSVLSNKKNMGKYSNMTQKEMDETKKAIEQAQDTEYHRSYESIEWYKIGECYNRGDQFRIIKYRLKLKLIRLSRRIKHVRLF